jgi:hypothetical protein
MLVVRYQDAPTSGLPGDARSPDPGPGQTDLQDVNATSALTPLVPDPAPNATRAFPLTVDFQKAPDGLFLGFMNSTVRRGEIPVLDLKLWGVLNGGFFFCCFALRLGLR